MAQGLFQPNCLQFGLHSATGIFQREKDKRLGRLLFAKVRLNNILISGKTGVEHLNNLKAVLKFLKKSGLRLTVSMCSFIQPEVIFCGFIINNEGYKLTAQNMEAVLNVPRSTIVNELRGFLGKANYSIIF